MGSEAAGRAKVGSPCVLFWYLLQLDMEVLVFYNKVCENVCTGSWYHLLFLALQTQWTRSNFLTVCLCWVLLTFHLGCTTRSVSGSVEGYCMEHLHPSRKIFRSVYILHNHRCIYADVCSKFFYALGKFDKFWALQYRVVGGYTGLGISVRPPHKFLTSKFATKNSVYLILV